MEPFRILATAQKLQTIWVLDTTTRKPNMEKHHLWDTRVVYVYVYFCNAHVLHLRIAAKMNTFLNV